MNLSDTIAALSTAQGRGAIAVFRVSGRDTLTLLNSLIPFENVEPRRMYRHQLKGTDGEFIDEIMYVFYKSPNSYTGEDMVELFSHGGYAVCDQIMRLLLSVGIRLAEPGEFTFRAVVNNKMNIIKAEAVDALCSAENEEQFRLARLGITDKSHYKFDMIYREFLDIYSTVVASVEFEEEEVDGAIMKLNDGIQNLLLKLSDMIKNYESLRYAIEGASVVIAGKTNVGKSSLFNRLVEEERAIVTELPGTTRDVIDKKTFLNQIPIRFVDTAGLREAEDKIELIGQRKTSEEIKKADIILYMIDVESGMQDIDRKVMDENKEKIILVANKIDLNPDFKLSYIKNVFYISAKFETGVDRLKSGIQDYLRRNINKKIDSPVFNSRQYHIILNIYRHLENTYQLIRNGNVLDVLLLELKGAEREFERLFGRDIGVDLYQNIFSRFCIGK